MSTTFQFILIITSVVITSQNTYSHQEIETQHWNEEKEPDITTSRETNQQNSVIPIVKCPAGTFQGSVKYTREGKRYFEFQSIPYAEPPKRFEPAVPKAPIEEEYDATTEPPVCPQVPNAQAEFVGQEDCLYLSVSKPDESHCRREISNCKLLPVLFWIHPGVFEHGNGSFYKGAYLLDECIVLVTINYRLGAFGFLTTEDNVIPGNLGLKDQVLALKWTRRNIRYFQGDPKQVTIAGSSAGGSSVTHHICSPASSGLFSRGIDMSLAILSPTSVTEKPRKYAEALVNKFNCSDTSSEGIKTCLLRQSAEDIVLNSLAVASNRFSPVIEPQNAISPFQNVVPYQLLKTGQINRVPLLAGFVQDEGIIYAERVLSNPRQLRELNTAWLSVAPVQFYYNDLNIPKPELNRISNSIRYFYFQNQPISEKQRQNLINLFSDRRYIQGIYETVQLISRHIPTYMYINTYKGGISNAQIMYGYKVPVITHLDDEQYIFPKFKLWLPGTEQFEFSKDMVELWTNFMRSGKPHGRTTEKIPWEMTNFRDPVYRKVFNLDNPVKIIRNLFRTRTIFWRGLGLYKYEFAELSVRTNKGLCWSNSTCID